MRRIFIEGQNGTLFEFGVGNFVKFDGGLTERCHKIWLVNGGHSSEELGRFNDYTCAKQVFSSLKYFICSSANQDTFHQTSPFKIPQEKTQNE